MHSFTRRTRHQVVALTAAVLVPLATAACEPAGLLGGATASGDQVPAPQAATDPGAGTREQILTGSAEAPAPDALPEIPPAPPATPDEETPVDAGAAPVELPEQSTPVQPSEVQPSEVQPSEVQPTAVQPTGAPVQASRTPGTARGRRPTGGRPSSAPPVAPVAPAAPATKAPAAAGGTSAGSGGSYTDQGRQTFRAGNGQSGQYLLYAGGIDPARPVGLVVYVDGTGEYGVDNPDSSYALGGPSGLVTSARSRNMITLAVESPDQSCECWHTGNTSAYADFLAQLIESRLAAYPVDELWLTGFSSGAQEITRFLVPRHPELLRLGGGWVVFGGGGPPADGGAAVTSARMAGVRGHWFTGTADTEVPLTASWGAQAGERFYGARGVVASHDYPQGVGHALDGRLGRTVGQIIDGS